ncbi:class I SAM-dependent methyltransferase [Iamia sp.]|uniref:class I SAM-dependent methyltransferase n=1 Tax=Iamia sp. TaxID=2722710 RepID=UPI002BB907A6|nr:class I SAM-dependent methyltransferase [Iamia sp.]HXH56677.1 class I SAM-dependent methyltransferase [Iamia sp.]
MTEATDTAGAVIDDDVPTGNTYDKYASQNPIERRLMDGFFGALDASLPPTAPGAILEVGVGEGEVAERLRARWPGVPIAGIDLPDHELAAHWIGKAHSGAFADIGRLPFPDDSFDLVLAIEVLEHVPDPIRALRELNRVCRRDLVLSVPRERIWCAANLARGKYLKDLGNTPGHINHWSKRGFGLLVGSTFTVRAVRSPFPWTMVAASVRTPA